MTSFITNSVLTRLLANVFLFMLVLGCTLVAGVEILRDQPLNIWVASVLSVAMGSSIKILGISTGVSIAQSSNTP